MKNRKIILKTVICIIALSIISTVAVYAILPSDTQSEGGKSEAQITLDKLKNHKISATTYEEWKKSQKKTNNIQNAAPITKEKLNQLYDSGYSLNDIEKAESISILSGKDVDEILKLKYYYKDNTLITSNKSWEEIESDLSIDKNKSFNKLKISKDKVNKLKNKHFSDDQIIEVGILALNYGKDYDKIIKDMESGKKYDQLDKEYWEERNINLKNEAKSKVLNQKELENRIKVKSKISEDEIQLSKEYGINHILDIGYAKNLTKKYKTTLKHVLKLKSEKKYWSTVISTLEEGE